jgi:hypothetical protein
LADKKQKLLLISTCGFPEADNFDALQQHFRAICRNFWAENAGEILVSAAGMAEAPRFFEEKCALVKEAGKQFASQGKIEQELLSKISLEGIDREEYRKIANAAFRGGFLGNLEAAFRSMRAMLPHRKPPASTGD